MRAISITFCCILCCLIGCRDRGTIEDYREHRSEYGLADDASSLLESYGELPGTIGVQGQASELEPVTAGDTIVFEGTLPNSDALMLKLKLQKTIDGAQHDDGSPIIVQAGSKSVKNFSKGKWSVEFEVPSIPGKCVASLFAMDADGTLTPVAACALQIEPAVD